MNCDVREPLLRNRQREPGCQKKLVFVRRRAPKDNIKHETVLEEHGASGAAFLVLPGAVAVWIVRRRGADDELQCDDLTPHPARTLLLHGVCAALCVGHLTAGFHLLHAAGFGVSGLDRDRTAIEEKLQFLEEAGQFDRAADIVQERLGHAPSDGWRQALAERLYRNLLNAGKECKELRERRERFAKALDVAQRHQLDSALALRLDEDSLLEGEFLNRLDTLRGGKDWRGFLKQIAKAPSRRINGPKDSFATNASNAGSSAHASSIA